MRRIWASIILVVLCAVPSIYADGIIATLSAGLTTDGFSVQTVLGFERFFEGALWMAFALLGVAALNHFFWEGSSLG